jgi:hypothetical protein
VIHRPGPIHGRDEPSDASLSSCYREALWIALRVHMRVLDEIIAGAT